MRFSRRLGPGDPVDWGLIAGNRRDSPLLCQKGGGESRCKCRCRWGQVYLSSVENPEGFQLGGGGGGAAGWVFRRAEKVGVASIRLEK